MSNKSLTCFCHLQLCLSLHFLLEKSLKISQRWNLGPYPIFSEHTSSPEHMCGLLYSLIYVQVFQSLIPSFISFIQPLPKPSSLSAVCPSAILCLRQLLLVYLPLNAFHKCHPRGRFSPENSKASETKLLTNPSGRNLTDTQPYVFETKVYIASSGTSKSH